MRNVSHKCCRETNTHILCSITKKLVPFYEIMWKNTVQPDRSHTTSWRTRIACWIPTATNTHSEYAILIASPLQQRLHERTSCYVIPTLPDLSLLPRAKFWILALSEIIMWPIPSAAFPVHSSVSSLPFDAAFCNADILSKQVATKQGYTKATIRTMPSLFAPL